MANTIPNQPIVFNESPNCWLEDSGMKVLVEYGDITQFQMKLSPCGSDLNLIQNGNFADSSNWTTTSDAWRIANGTAIKREGISGQLFQSAPTTDGTLVRLTFDVIISQGEVRLSWSGQNIIITESGSYEFWIEADSASNVAFTASGSTIATLSNVQLISVNTNFTVNIVNDAGSIVDTLETVDGYFDFSDGYFTCSIDWEALAIPEDCYTLQVIDPCPCSQGGIIATDFTTSTFEWAISGGWTIASGTATFNSSSSGSARLLNTLCSGTTYEVTYTVSGVTLIERFQVFLGGVGGIQRTSDGTYTEQITSGGSTFRMTGLPSIGTATFTVTDFSIKAVDPEPTFTSNTIKVSEVFNCTTLALAMCNDSDAFGFGFDNTGFRPLMRIPASLTRSSYPMERLSYDNSIGRKATYYARSRKAKELGFDGLEFMHDFAHLFGMADHFYIDDVEYFVEDDEYPSISWAENDDIGGVTIIVSEKVQLIENRRLSSSSVGCLPSGEELLDSNLEVITDSQDSAILTG